MVNNITSNKLFVGFTRQMEERLIADIYAWKEKDPLQPVWVLVPSHLTGVYLRRLLASRLSGHVNIEFTTLPDLARELAGYSEGKKTILPFYGEDRILQKAIQNITSDSYFAPVANYDGFHRALKQTFQEVRESGAEEYLAEMSGKKAEDLQELWNEYNYHLEGFSDPLADYGEVSRLDSENITVFPLFVYGIYRLNNLQKEMLATLVQTGPTHVYLPSFLMNHQWGQDIISWLESTGIMVEKLPSEKSGSWLSVIQQNIFDSSQTGSSVESQAEENVESDLPGEKEDDSLQVWSAPGEVREAMEIGRKIVSLASRGYLLRDMAVLINDPAYYSLLGETLRSLELPYYMPAGITLDTTSTGKSFLMCLDLRNGEWSRQEVAELLSLAPFDYSLLGEENSEPLTSLWNYLSIQAGITSGRSSWFSHLESLKNKLAGDLEKAAENDDDDAPDVKRLQEHISHLEMLQEFIRKLSEWLDSIPEKGSWKGILERMESFISNLFKDTKEKEIILNNLNLLHGLDKLDQEIEFAEARDLLGQALRETHLPQGRFQKEGITVCPITAAEGLQFKVVFVPGLLEGKFPRPCHQDPLILDEERKKLGPKISLRREEYEKQTIAFSAAVNTARDLLIFSYPRFDSRSGSEQLPSPFLLQAGESLTGETYGMEKLSKLPGFKYISSVNIAQPDSAILEREFDRCLIYNEPYPVLKEYFAGKYPWYNNLTSSWKNRGNESFTEFEGIINSMEMGRTLANYSPWEKTVSASYLEDYITCPYMFFLKRVLGLEALQEPEELLRMGPPERGTLVHQILERFYQQAKSILPLRAENRESALLLMEKVMEETFQEVEAEGWVGYPLFWGIDRENIKADMFGLVDDEISLEDPGVPAYFEIPFGRKKPLSCFSQVQTDAPVSLSVDSRGSVFFRGRIDRVDELGESGLQVIDYKTGKVRIDEKNLQQGISLQLSIYIMAAKELFQSPHLNEIQALYYYVTRQSEYKRVKFSGKELHDKYELLQEVVTVIADGIKEGNFFPSPDERSKCKYCDYLGVCGTDIQRVVNHKAEDQRYKKYLETAEMVTPG